MLGVLSNISSKEAESRARRRASRSSLKTPRVFASCRSVLRTARRFEASSSGTPPIAKTRSSAATSRAGQEIGA